jgi:hypothetical protein
VSCILILTKYLKDYEKGHRHGEFQHQPPPIISGVFLLMQVQQQTEMMNSRNQEHMARIKDNWISVSNR